MRKNAVITGMGLLTPFGQGIEAFLDAIKESDSCFTKSAPSSDSIEDAFDVKAQLCGKIDRWNFVQPRYMNFRKYSQLHRFQQWLFIACADALQDSGLKRFFKKTDRIGIINASDLYHLYSLENLESQQMVEKNTPASISNILALYLRINGPTFSIAAGECSGLVAVGQASELIRNDRCDIVVVTCGTQLNNSIRCGYEELGYISIPPHECLKPFDKKRNGTILSEGAGCIIVEARESAVRREVDIYGEIIGYAISCKHNTAGPAIQSSMQQSLHDAEITHANVDFICASANGNIELDRSERDAVNCLFDANIPVSGIKSMTGETLHASGVINTIAGLLSINEGFIPATINCHTVDGCLNIAGHRRDAAIETALINSISYNGVSASLLLKKCDNKGPFQLP